MSNKVLKPMDPNTDQRIYLIYDSSNVGLSGWIAQMQDDCMIRPARFPCEKFNNAQMNYGITKKELRAIVDSVRHLWWVLQGHTVTILIDHQPLVAVMSFLQTNQMLIRWQESPRQLDINIEHIDGNKNAIADARSRTHEESPFHCSKQFLLSPVHSHGTLVLTTVTTQHLTGNLSTSTTLPSITTIPC